MEHRANLEVIAPSVDEAIQKGLDELGLNEDQVDVQVLDEGGSGLFGLGGRQARVRLTVKGSTASKPASYAPAAPMTAEDAENMVAITKATVQELLHHMDVRAEVDAQLGEPDDEESPAPVMVDVRGGDLSFLIGRNAETLNALQLVTRLIVSKEVGSSAHVVIDIEGFRKRREDTLRQLADRMAQQAVSTGRRQSLEPMSPSERRVIHMALRDHAEVTTESSGEEPRRKVVIIPKE